MPRRMNRSVSTSMTSMEETDLRRTRMARLFTGELVQDIEHAQSPAVIWALPGAFLVR